MCVIYTAGVVVLVTKAAVVLKTGEGVSSVTCGNRVTHSSHLNPCPAEPSKHCQNFVPTYPGGGVHLPGRQPQWVIAPLQ